MQRSILQRTRARLDLKARSKKLTLIALSVLGATTLLTNTAFADLAVSHREIGVRARKSLVPEITAQGRFLSPQAVSAVDVSPDGKLITAGTMAFSHDANVWQFGPDGTVLAKRHFPPWAPMQVATLRGGHAMGVGLAYSRVTSPDPTVWLGPSADLFSAKRGEELVEADASEGQLARLRPGGGDWRTGWLASHLGELFVCGPDWLFKPPRWLLDTEGRRQELRFERKNQLPTGRAMRMAASADGSRIAFGWLRLPETATGLPKYRDAVSVWSVNPNQKLWAAPPLAEDRPPPPPLPDPALDFPEMAKDFRFAADAIVPAQVTASVALNRDGSRLAATEYGIWCWVRSRAAIGKWSPPIHALNFLPKQRGWLRAFDENGRELIRELLPEEGMFEAGWGPDSDVVWWWPAAWFARGVAGAVWLPVEPAARTLYRIELSSRRAEALTFPDAIADCAVSSRGKILVSCWDGRAGTLVGPQQVADDAQLGR